MFFRIITLFYVSVMFLSAYSLKEAIKVEVLRFNKQSQMEYKTSRDELKGICDQPFPQRFSLSEIFGNTQSVYSPCCVVLHRCNFQECCKDNKVWFTTPPHQENVTITVMEQDLTGRGQKRYLRLTFQNHTRCC